MSIQTELDAFWVNLNQSTLFEKWKRENPGEYNKLEDYLTERTGPPALKTFFGKALIHELKAYKLLTQPAPPPVDDSISIVQTYELTLQPQQKDPSSLSEEEPEFVGDGMPLAELSEGLEEKPLTASNKYAFGWVATDHPEAPWSGGKKYGYLDLKKNPEQFFIFGRRFDKGHTARTMNLHCSPYPSGWEKWENDPTINGVSPLAFDYYPGKGNWQGANGLQVVAEPNSPRGVYHWTIIPESTIESTRGDFYWIIAKIKFGRPGTIEVWALNATQKKSLGKVVDVTANTVWPDQDNLLVWNGGYDSSGVSSVTKSIVTLESRGSTLEEALKNIPVEGEIWNSVATGSFPASSLVRGMKVNRPDGLIKQIVK